MSLTTIVPNSAPSYLQQTTVQPVPLFSTGTYGQPPQAASTNNQNQFQNRNNVNSLPRAVCGYSPWMSFRAGATTGSNNDYTSLLNGDSSAWTSTFRKYVFSVAPKTYFGIIIIFSIAVFFFVLFVVWRSVVALNNIYGTISRYDIDNTRRGVKGRALIGCQIALAIVALAVVVTGIVGAVYVQKNLATDVQLSLSTVQDFVTNCLNSYQQINFYLQNTNINLQLINSTSNLQIYYPMMGTVSPSSNTRSQPNSSFNPPLAFSSNSGQATAPTSSSPSSATVVSPIQNLQAIKSWVMALPDPVQFTQYVQTFESDYRLIEGSTQNLSKALQNNLYPNLANICNQSYYIGYGTQTLYTMPTRLTQYYQAINTLAQLSNIQNIQQVNPTIQASNNLDFGNKSVVIDNLYKATNYSQSFTQSNPLPQLNTALQTYQAKTNETQNLLPILAQYTGLIINPFIQYQPNQWIPGVIAFIQQQNNVPYQVVLEATMLTALYNSVEFLLDPNGGNMTNFYNMIGNLSLVLNNTQLSQSVNSDTQQANSIIQQLPKNLGDILGYFRAVDQSFQNLYGPYTQLINTIINSNGSGLLVTAQQMPNIIQQALAQSQIPTILQSSIYQLGNQSQQLYYDINDSLNSLVQVQQNLNISSVLLNNFFFSANLNNALTNFTQTLGSFGNRTGFLNYTYAYFNQLSSQNQGSTSQYIITTPRGVSMLTSSMLKLDKNSPTQDTQVSVSSVQASVASYQRNSSSYNNLRNASLVQLQQVSQNFQWTTSADRLRYVFTVIVFSVTSIGTLLVLVFILAALRVVLLVFTFLLICALIVLTVLGWLYAAALALASDFCSEYNLALTQYVSNNPPTSQFSQLLNYYITGQGTLQQGLQIATGISTLNIQQTASSSIQYLDQLQNSTNLNTNTSSLVKSANSGLGNLQYAIGQFVSTCSQTNFAVSYTNADNMICCQLVGQLGLVYFVIFLQALFILVYLFIAFVVVLLIDIGMPQIFVPNRGIRFAYNRQ